MMPHHIELVVGALQTALYAAGSSDWNPLHFEKAAAAKAGFCTPLAHGMNVATLAISEFVQFYPDLHIGAIDCVFDAPVPIGERLVLTVNWEGLNACLRVEGGDGQVKCRLTVEFRDRDQLGANANDMRIGAS